MLHQLARVVLLAPVILAACPEPGIDCTNEIVWSARVLVTDADGNALDDARVVWANDTTERACSEGGDAGEYLCGEEIAGEMTISVAHTGYVAQDLPITVAEDACHVITEQLTVALQAE